MKESDQVGACTKKLTVKTEPRDANLGAKCLKSMPIRYLEIIPYEKKGFLIFKIEGKFNFLNHFKVYNSMVVSIFTVLYTYEDNFRIWPQKKSHNSKQTVLISPPFHFLKTTKTFSVPMVFAYSEITEK